MSLAMFTLEDEQLVPTDIARSMWSHDQMHGVATSGALEYVSLHAGLGELSRVLKPGGFLFHLPVRPAPASAFLELLFRFKTHPPQEVEAHTESYLRIISRYRFPVSDIIGWTKLALMAQKQ